MPKVAVLVHQADAGLGSIGLGLDDAGWEVVQFRVAEGDPFPVLDDFDALIVMGASAHPDQRAEHAWMEPEEALIRDALAREMPILGVCFGCQILSQAAGGEAYRLARPEIGWIPLAIVADDDPVLGGLPVDLTACVWHCYAAALPEGAVPLAHSPASLQAYRVGERAWGIQFHPEVSEADFRSWMGKSAGDMAAAGVTSEVLEEGVRERMAAWQDVGREIGRRFAAAAAPVASS